MTPDLVSAWCSTAPLLIPRGGSHTRDRPGPVFGGSEVHREGQRSPGASQVLTYLLPRHLVIWGLGLGTHPLGAPPFVGPSPCTSVTLALVRTAPSAGQAGTPGLCNDLTTSPVGGHTEPTRGAPRLTRCRVPRASSAVCPRELPVCEDSGEAAKSASRCRGLELRASEFSDESLS